MIIAYVCLEFSAISETLSLETINDDNHSFSLAMQYNIRKCSALFLIA